MISIVALWLPIVLAAVVVFVVSSIIHMFLGYHKNDFRKVPNEEEAMNALAPMGIPPGDYVMPYAGSMEAMKSEEYKANVERGPVMFFTVMDPAAVFNMGPQLVQWFAYCMLVGVMAALVAGRMLPVGASYTAVFHLTGAVAFASYAMALPQRSIWYKQSWASTLRSMFDGLVYASLTAGVFGWLWPAA
jgi:hypothetical protein